MAIHVALTVDLNGSVSTEARTIFNRALAAEHFVKHKLTTLWTAHFAPGHTKESAISYVKKVVAAAAGAAGIRNYEALVMPSDQAPTEWKSS